MRAMTVRPESDSIWVDGWWSSASLTRSSNFGPRPPNINIDLLVIHSISLPPGEFGTDNVHALFTNKLDWDAHPYFSSIRGLQVSSHFFITRSGDICQFVSCDQRAWHAGQSSYCGRSNCNDSSIGIELEGIEGGHFETIQYAQLAALCKSIQTQYPVAHVAGHEHIAPGRKSDPGTGFNWTFLQQLTAFPDHFFPTETLAPEDAKRGV